MKATVQIKSEYWYKELDGHIRAIHSTSGQRKTILLVRRDRYLVVTRVNHLTTLLWKDSVNEKMKNIPALKDKLITRIGWLEQQKKYRRELDEKVKQSA